MEIRINKYLATAGVGARRKVERMLWDGEIEVNGVKAVPGQLIDDNDVVTRNGERIVRTNKLIYIALNKPVGVVSTTSDEKGRPTVMDLIPFKERLYPVGRLDQNSTGLILLTNDGDLALRLTHPRYHLPKTYEVTTKENISDYQLNRLRNGVLVYDQKTDPAFVKLKGPNSFQIILHQGLKRQIREMCKNVGLNVKSLHRVQIGPITLGRIKAGEFRELSPKELEVLSETKKMEPVDRNHQEETSE